MERCFFPSVMVPSMSMTTTLGHHDGGSHSMRQPTAEGGMNIPTPPLNVFLKEMGS